MKKLSQQLNRFFLRHRDKGIRNLMLYLAIGNAIMFVIGLADPSNLVYSFLCFDRTAILQGQVWRLLTFLIAPSVGGNLFSVFLSLLMLFFYYRIGLMLEQRLGVFKFNLFYLTGVILMDAAGLLFPMYVSASALNMSLIMAFAVMYSEAQVLIMYVIPVKMKYLAWVYIIVTVLECVMLRTLLPLIPFGNFVLFFWEELPTLLPASWRFKKVNHRTYVPPRRPTPNWADGYQSKSGQKPYRHKCTVCGRTDAENPNLEFRYCSRCSGYRCYCMEHINNHAHITE